MIAVSITIRPHRGGRGYMGFAKVGDTSVLVFAQTEDECAHALVLRLGDVMSDDLGLVVEGAS